MYLLNYACIHVKFTFTIYIMLYIYFQLFIYITRWPRYNAPRYIARHSDILVTYRMPQCILKNAPGTVHLFRP